ncbi:MAG: cyclic nucleotide-binding domain-containing protein [Termitinemataceae bacterium]|nr:MAG: cyclic nucleotide-binding domain-containing protein [Termitinemataceae bacterium]
MVERPQLSVVTYRKGMYVILEGNRDSDRFFIVQSGNIQLSRKGETLLQELNSSLLSAGDFFGIVSSMAQKRQIETAQAMTDVTLIAVNRAQFDGLIQFNTPIAMKIIQQFSRRMRFLNSQLTSLTLNSVGETSSAVALFTSAQYYFKQKRYIISSYAYKRFIQCYPYDSNIEIARQNLEGIKQYDKPNYRTGNAPFVRQYGDDMPVFVEGESGDELFIIQSGSVKITKVINEEEVMLAVLKSGDIFGEMAILESKPRSANAITYNNAVLMVVQRSNFEGLSATQPQVITRLTQLLAERIWFSYRQIESAAIKDPVGRCFDCLLINIERANISIQSKTSYTFNFGLEELTKMASIPEHDAKAVCKKVLANEKISISYNKIVVSDVMELVKLSEFYRKTSRGVVNAVF